MLPSNSLAHIFPPSIGRFELGVRFRLPPRAIQSLPCRFLGLHPSTRQESPVASGYSAACRPCDSWPTNLSFSFRPSITVTGLAYLFAPPFGCWSASLALPTTRPTMPYADFCAAVRTSFDNLSRRGDTEQISRGKFGCLPCTIAGSTLRTIDGYGLRSK